MKNLINQSLDELMYLHQLTLTDSVHPRTNCGRPLFQTATTSNHKFVDIVSTPLERSCHNSFASSYISETPSSTSVITLERHHTEIGPSVNPHRAFPHLPAICTSFDTEHSTMLDLKGREDPITTVHNVSVVHDAWSPVPLFAVLCGRGVLWSSFHLK